MVSKVDCKLEVLAIVNSLSEIETVPAKSEKFSALPFLFIVPVKFKSPFTSNFDEGLFEPIPTLPVFNIVNLSAWSAKLPPV